MKTLPVRLFEKASRFLRRPFREQLLLCEALCYVLLVRLALWLVSARRVMDGVNQLPLTSRSGLGGDIPAQVAAATRGVARLVPHASCLTQALAAQALLRRHGFLTRLRFGGRHDEKGNFSAHAWLEHEGRVILGGALDSSLVPFPQLPE